MANPAHLEKLCEGPKAWNVWREGNPNIVPDLTDIQLTLHQRQLGPSNGGPIDLHAADLEHAVLRYATLTGADLEGSRLVGVDLTHARLDKAKLAGANLTDAILDQADMTGAILDQAVLFGADLSDTRNLTLPQIEQAFGDASTRLPSNLLPPQSWFPSEIETDDYDDDYSGWGMAAYEEPVQQTLYEELGLTEKAASEEIRAAYRVLVKKLHPDLNPNDEEAQDRFKRVTTAYRILNDAHQRAKYDRGEIDGEGRVDPDFEARRQFRRTAFRYYGAAAASFILAAFVLVGVWYTVLSIVPEEGAPQIAAVTPKRSERLGTGAPASVRVDRTERDTALLETDPQRGETVSTKPKTRPEETPVNEGDANGEAAADAVNQADAPNPPDNKLAEADASRLEAGNAAPSQSGNVTLPTTPSGEPAETVQSEAKDAASGGAFSSASGVFFQYPPFGVPAELQGSPLPPPVMAEAEPGGAAQPGQRKGEAQRPLRQGHNSAAGPTIQSAPESGSVAALPSNAQPDWSSNNIVGLRIASAEARGGKLPLSRWAQYPASRDIVSQVLRVRAIRQTLGEKRRPLTATEGGALPQQRRPGVAADFPTNTLAPPNPLQGKRYIPTKPTSATLQRKRPDGTASADQAGRSPNASRQSTKREIRQKQVVSDVLSGGL